MSLIDYHTPAKLPVNAATTGQTSLKQMISEKGMILMIPRAAKLLLGLLQQAHRQATIAGIIRFHREGWAVTTPWNMSSPGSMWVRSTPLCIDMPEMLRPWGPKNWSVALAA